MFQGIQNQIFTRLLAAFFLLLVAGFTANVFAGEGEVALSMTEHILRQLGATEEQIDRESERIRSDLFEKTVAAAVETAPKTS